MAGKTDTFENDILKLIFWGTPIANIADNASASPLTTLYLSLHTADPTDAAASGQSTNEVSYGGYARVALARSASGWNIAGNVVTPVANVEWPAVTSGSGTVTHVGIGTSASGTGKLLYSGAVSPSIPFATGWVPRITTASTITED